MAPLHDVMRLTMFIQVRMSVRSAVRVRRMDTCTDRRCQNYYTRLVTDVGCNKYSLSSYVWPSGLQINLQTKLASKITQILNLDLVSAYEKLKIKIEYKRLAFEMSLCLESPRNSSESHINSAGILSQTVAPK